MGGFMLSKAAEHHGTHVQMADRVLRIVGTTSNPRIVLAFLLTTAGLSMWISNTATTLIMLPVAIAVLARSPSQALAVPLMLSIAYGASIGGLATPIGTPPNLIFMSNYQTITGQSIPFATWMMIGLPITGAMLVLAFVVLAVTAGRGSAIQLPPLQRWTTPQVLVLVVFGITAVAWMTRVAPYGGWERWLGLGGVDDSTVALLAVIALFIIPTFDGRGRRLLNWDLAGSIPWGLLLLFAGGIALARGFQTSGLDRVIGESLGDVAAWHPLMLIATIALVVTFLTEIANNTAVATLLMPLLGAVAAGAGMEPALMMIPAAISASCAFMLPVATAPNAIVFSSERVTIPQMARRGVALNLAGTVTISLLCYLLIGAVLKRLE
jgi:solute carrier family 13 (sodium-dependent dicarboxylate transporter), member 2/3/5